MRAGGTLLVAGGASPSQEASPLARQNPQPVKALLNTVEAAQRMGISRSTLYRMIRAKEIPWIRIGARGVRISTKDIADWVNRNTHHGTERK